MYGIEVSKPYGIDEVMVSTYGFVSHTNHERETIRVRRKDFLQNGDNQFIVQVFYSM